ncbi:MAG: choice-of-anchor V domain-containing protein, partial [Bacteroidia bacterium]
NGVAGYTNAPGETTCTDCHITYPLNSPGGSVSINLSPSINTYMTGQTYTIGITIKRPGPILFGLDCEVLDSTGANAGTISLINTSTTILLNSLIGTNNRTNVAQYGGVFANDSCTFYFKWVAPSYNLGNITIYTAVNASNGDGYSAGDYIYTTSEILTPDFSTSLNERTKNLSLLSYPNPVDRNITLCYYLSNDSKVVAELISLSGQPVRPLFCENGRKGNNYISLDLSTEIVPGAYFIRLVSEHESSSSLIIMK